MFSNYSDEPIYNVKAVVTQSGVTASTLRAWERRYGVPTPPRNMNGYRLYSARDIAIIRWLKAQVDVGMTISQAVNLMHIESPLIPGAEQTDPKAKSPGSPVDGGVRSYQQLHDEIVECALCYDEFGVEQLLTEAFSLFPVEEVCLQLLHPVLISMGDGWYRGKITISVEHFTTNIVRRKLFSLISACPLPTRSERIILGCAPEEFHEIGILLAALFLRRRGLNVVYLGQNVASERLEEIFDLIKPAIVILSASTIGAAERLLDIADSFVTHKSYPITLAYAGLIFQLLERMREHISAVYLGDDLIQGVDRVLALLDNPGLSHMAHIPVPIAARSAADFYRLNQVEIILRATQHMLAEARGQSALLHQYVLNRNRQFAAALGTALRFGDPQLLNHLTSDDFHPDGQAHVPVHPGSFGDHQSDRYLTHFRNAIKQLTSESANAAIQLYLDVYEQSHG